VKKYKESIQSILRLTTINLVVFLVLLELFAVIYYWLVNRQFFYSGHPTISFNQEIEVENITQEVTRVRLHPYIGYIKKQVNQEQLGFKVNNYGLAFPYDYPYQKISNNQLLIGVFGGSVAAGFAAYEAKNKVVAKKLQQLPQFANKEIIILPFARSGYKQPQMLMMLNYFMSIDQKFDLVINIDGFNDVAISSANNRAKVALSMPNIEALQPLINLASNNVSIEELSLTLEANKFKNNLAQSRQNQAKCWLAMCYLFSDISGKYFQNKYQNYQVKIADLQKNKVNNNDSFIYLDRVSSILPDPVLYEKTAALWAESSLLMHGVLSSKNIPYFHFLQPNQYYPTGRKFSEAERKISILPNHPYAPSVKNGYPYLLKKIDFLKQNRVKIFNGVNIFDQVSDIVYLDTCCHYNDRGNEILGNYIAQVIFDAYSRP
jgi:hypothetical protein